MNTAGHLRKRVFARLGAPRQRGQGMTEYIIIVALVALAAIGTYSLFGQTVRNQTAGLALELSGTGASAAISDAQTTAGTAQTNANKGKDLATYNNNNKAVNP